MDMKLEPVGVWLYAGVQTPADVEREQLARIDSLGYDSLWIGEGTGGRDVFTRSAVMLGVTRRLVMGTGIANVWARPPETAQAAARALAEAFPARFVLGLGIGHPFQADHVGGQYGRPLAHMRGYLGRMDAEAAANPPAARFPRVLAAVGPKMLELARELTDGAHPFHMPVAHTAAAREILGPRKLLIPHQAVLLDTDPTRARDRAREGVRAVLGVPAYRREWHDRGYTEVDDRLVDAAVAWGDEEAIARRVCEQLDAGADHVLVSPVGSDLVTIVDQLERLAPALIGVAA